MERVRPEVVDGMPCAAWIASCHCARRDTHDLHECGCGGQWTGSDGAGDAAPKRLPQTPSGIMLDEMFTALGMPRG